MSLNRQSIINSNTTTVFTRIKMSFILKLLITTYMASTIGLFSHWGIQSVNQNQLKKELDQERKEFNSKMAMWVGVDSVPTVGNLHNLMFNWMYVTKLQLEGKGESPNLVDPRMKELPQLAQLLAVKKFGGNWNSGITLGEYLGMSSSDFKAAYEQFNSAEEELKSQKFRENIGTTLTVAIVINCVMVLIYQFIIFRFARKQSFARKK